MITEMHKEAMLRDTSDSLISLSKFSTYPKIGHHEKLWLSEIFSNAKEVRTLEHDGGIMIFIEYENEERLTILNHSESKRIGKNSILRITEHTRIVSNTDAVRILEEIIDESKKEDMDFIVVRIFQDSSGSIIFEENGERTKNTDDAALQAHG